MRAAHAWTDQPLGSISLDHRRPDKRLAGKVQSQTSWSNHLSCVRVEAYGISPKFYSSN